MIYPRQNQLEPNANQLKNMVSDFRYQDVSIGKPKGLHWVRETITKTMQMPENNIENETFRSHLSYPHAHFDKNWLFGYSYCYSYSYRNIGYRVYAKTTVFQHLIERTISFHFMY